MNVANVEGVPSRVRVPPDGGLEERLNGVLIGAMMVSARTAGLAIEVHPCQGWPFHIAKTIAVGEGHYIQLDRHLAYLE